MSGRASGSILSFFFDDAAQEVYIAWITALHKKIEAESNPLIKQHLTKYDKLFPALALVFHMIGMALDASLRYRKLTRAAQRHGATSSNSTPGAAMAFSRTAEVSEFFVFLFDDFNATYVASYAALLILKSVLNCLPLETMVRERPRTVSSQKTTVHSCTGFRERLVLRSS